MARMNDTYPVGGFLRGVEQVVVVYAGQREQGVDTVREQGLDHGLGGIHAGHGVSRPEAADVLQHRLKQKFGASATDGGGCGAVCAVRQMNLTQRKSRRATKGTKVFRNHLV